MIAILSVCVYTLRLYRYATLEKKLPEGGSLRRTCEYCKECFANFLLLKEHLKSTHPEHKIR